VPVDRNVTQKEAENQIKHKILGIVIQRMWNTQCTTIPVITEATGIVTKVLEKNLETIPGKCSTDSLQKTATRGTSHIIRKVVQSETCSLSGGNHLWFKRGKDKGKGHPITGHEGPEGE